MADINDLRHRYFAWDSDIEITGELEPNTLDGNHVEYLIDGHAYFGALRQEINNLNQQARRNNPYFYFANWWLGLVKGPDLEITTTDTFTSAWKGNPGLTEYQAFQLDDGSNGPFPLLIDQLENMAKNDVDVRSLGFHPLS